MAATMGKDGFISIDGTTIAMALMDSWSVSPSIDMAEVTAFGDASKAFVSTLRSWTASVSGTLDRSNSQQLAVLDDFESTGTSTAHGMRLYTSNSETPGTYWSGSAFVTSQVINSQVGDKVSVSWTFQGTGDFSQVTS